MSFASTRMPQPISFPTSERGIIVLFNNTTKEMSKICERPHEIAIYSTRKIFNTNSYNLACKPIKAQELK